MSDLTHQPPQPIFMNWKVLIEWIFGKDGRRWYPVHRRFCRARYERFHRSREHDVAYERYWMDRLRRGY